MALKSGKVHTHLFLDPVIELQKWAICILTYRNRAYTDELSFSSNLLLSSWIYVKAALVFMFKYKCSMLPFIFKEHIFSFSHRYHACNTHRMHSFTIPFLKLGVCKQHQRGRYG